MYKNSFAHSSNTFLKHIPMATPAPKTFHFGENGVSVLQSRVTILESDNKEKTKKIESLTADLEKLKGLYRKTIRGEEQDSYDALQARFNEFRQTAANNLKVIGQQIGP